MLDRFVHCSSFSTQSNARKLVEVILLCSLSRQRSSNYHMLHASQILPYGSNPAMAITNEGSIYNRAFSCRQQGCSNCTELARSFPPYRSSRQNFLAAAESTQEMPRTVGYTRTIAGRVSGLFRARDRAHTSI